MKTSLISVTFRKKTVEEIVDIACKGGLSAIEWGGDKHIVPGDKEAISLAKQLCQENGLSVSAYGSYYRCNDGEDFAAFFAGDLVGVVGSRSGIVDADAGDDTDLPILFFEFFGETGYRFFVLADVKRSVDTLPFLRSYGTV